jgi:hypothetical protein
MTRLFINHQDRLTLIQGNVAYISTIQNVTTSRALLHTWQSGQHEFCSRNASTLAKAIEQLISGDVSVANLHELHLKQPEKVTPKKQPPFNTHKSTNAIVRI